MVNEEAIEAFLVQGKTGIDQYYKYKHQFQENLSDAEKDDARKRLKDEFMTGLSTNAQLREEIVKAMKEKIINKEKLLSKIKMNILWNIPLIPKVVTSIISLLNIKQNKIG